MSSTTLSVGKGAPRVQNDTAQRAFVRARLSPMVPERRAQRSSGRVIAVRLLTLLRSDPQARAIGRLIAGVSTGDQCIVLTGDDPARREVLDRIAHELASLRCRVVRVAANEADEFSLQDFVQQLSGQLGSDGGTEDTLERVHRYLTEVDAGCDRIALLIDHAHRLQSLSSNSPAVPAQTSGSCSGARVRTPQSPSHLSSGSFRPDPRFASASACPRGRETRPRQR